jgi:hypothetical protein
MSFVPEAQFPGVERSEPRETAMRVHQAPAGAADLRIQEISFWRPWPGLPVFLLFNPGVARCSAALHPRLLFLLPPARRKSLNNYAALQSALRALLGQNMLAYNSYNAELLLLFVIKKMTNNPIAFLCRREYAKTKIYTLFAVIFILKGLDPAPHESASAYKYFDSQLGYS